MTRYANGIQSRPRPYPLVLLPEIADMKMYNKMDSFPSAQRIIQFIHMAAPFALADASGCPLLYFVDDRVPTRMTAIRVSSMLTCHLE